MSAGIEADQVDMSVLGRHRNEDCPDESTEPPADWRDLAACKGQLRLFFAPKAERPQARERREAKAKRFCDICPAIDECRQFAREHREYGYWAGENEEDRHLLGYRVSAPIGVRTRLARAAERDQESA